MTSRTWECKLCTNWNESDEDRCQVCGVDRPKGTTLSTQLKGRLESLATAGTNIIQTAQGQPKDRQESYRKERLLPSRTNNESRSRSSSRDKNSYVPPNYDNKHRTNDNGNKALDGQKRLSSRKQGKPKTSSSKRNISLKRSVSTISSKSTRSKNASGSSDDSSDHSTLRDSSSDSDDDANDDATPELEEVRLERLKEILTPQWAKKYNYPEHFTRLLVNFKFAQLKRREMYGSESPWGVLGLYEHLSAIRTDIKWASDVEERHYYRQPHLMWSENDAKQDDLWNIPVATYFIVTICTVLLIASMWMNDWKLEPFSENPTLGPSAQVLIQLGAKDTDLIVNQGEYWRLVTAMFLHAGLIHYALNMIGLLAIGKVIEQAHGSFALLFLFVVPAIGGTILSAVFLPKSISVGASGGIFGLMGACLADIVIHWSLMFSETVVGSGKCCKSFCVAVALIVDILLNSLIGLTPFVDNFTHLGGMLYGTFCAFLSVDRVRFSPKPYTKLSFRDQFFPFIGAIVVISGLVISTMILTESDGKNPPFCDRCQALSCVEFPPWKNSTEKWWYCDECGQTSADARVDDATGMYDMLKLYCPDGTVVEFELTGSEMTNDSTQIQSSLPTYCRMKCSNI